MGLDWGGQLYSTKSSPLTHYVIGASVYKGPCVSSQTRLVTVSFETAGIRQYENIKVVLHGDACCMACAMQDVSL